MLPFITAAEDGFESRGCVEPLQFLQNRSSRVVSIQCAGCSLHGPGTGKVQSHKVDDAGIGEVNRVLGGGIGAKLAGLRAGFGAGAAYLARNLLKKGGTP